MRGIKMFGYTGKLLFVDLTTGKTEVRDLDATTAKNYIGGPSLGAKILYDEMPANTDVFSSDSMIGFVSGPTNATGALMGGRYTVVSKSPVTGGFNDANSGGNFGPQMRKAGFDGIFVKGISEKPVYIFVDNGKAEIRDASRLWGKTTLETERLIKEELNDSKVGIALIGPAGEILSNIAAVMNDSHRAAARGGPGAVMGAKRLKAIAVRGNLNIEPKDRDALISINKQTVEWEKGPMAMMINMFSAQGTGGFYEASVLTGDASTKNWAGSPQELSEEQIRFLTSAEMDKLYKKKKFACNACPVGCGAIYELKEGKWRIEETSRPEYETLGSFGSMLLNGDSKSVSQCNYLCNEYGYDTISMGATIAWVMENYNKGVFTKEELNGIDLTWGNPEAIVQITELICKNEGIGKILNKGSQAAAEALDKGYAALVTAGGIEIPQHDSRYGPGLARTYQYDPTPGRHVKGGLGISHGSLPPEVKYDYSNTGEKDVEGVISQEIQNAAGFCAFAGFGLPPQSMQKYLNAITDFNYTDEEYKNAGLRSFAMRYAFNIREGFRRKDYKISDRIVGKPPLKDGPLAGVTLDNEKLGDNFFEALGWNVAEGVPGREWLEKVGGLEKVIADM
jgi:aldehyde:ferredoxin oxidoreductase